MTDQIETATCTLCAGQESPGFYTGCLVKDGHVTDWQCDGNGNLSRAKREPCPKCGAISGDDWSQCGDGPCPMGGPSAYPTAEDLK